MASGISAIVIVGTIARLIAIIVVAIMLIVHSSCSHKVTQM